ncbi:hypothetical protein Lepto7375DRAFT_6773 [Leptolyngbya sp. PCC 7375]|nr:hypothetical protein Lepto7375DRAFT_6773 [Leptolyngbya sp. PCC 7375]
MMTENSPSAYDGGHSLQPAKSTTRSHLRLTPEAVHQNWLDHFYTPAGYLYHLILALRKQGWWFRVENISQFCREWHINRRTFYRAKAELIANGKLEEHIKGSVNLRVPTLRQIDSPVTNLSPQVINLTQPETAQTQSADETESQQAFPNSPDPSQLPSNSSLKKREKIASLSPELEQPNSQGITLSPDAPEQPQTGEASLPGPQQWLDFSAEDDPDFFAFVIKNKIPLLPEPPASKQSAAQGWIRKYGNRLYTEYLQWLENQRQVQQRLTPIPPNEETPDQRLQRYQMLWQNPTCRKGVRTAIQTHPEWHLEIGPNGPRTQPPTPQAP